MHHVFHYHIQFLVAEQAGFSKAEAATLAYACALCDYALVAYTVQTPRARYELPVTHHYGIDSHRYQQSAWVPFHFFPGDRATANGARRDGRASPWTVTAHSGPVKDLLVAALKSRNLLRIGIALHTYADSWAHQNFSGLQEATNALGGGWLPPIGHAQAGSLPDAHGVSWTDVRLTAPRVNNNERFLAAAEMIYRYLCTYQKKSFDDWPRVLAELQPLFKPQAPEPLNKDKLRSERVGPDEAFIEQRLGILYDIGPFDPQAWLSAAVDPESRPTLTMVGGKLTQKVMAFADLAPTLKAPADFGASLIWQWSEAALEHRQEADRLTRALGLQ